MAGCLVALASFPDLPRFFLFVCFSVCIQYNTQKRKSAYTDRKPKKKRGRPGNKAIVALFSGFIHTQPGSQFWAYNDYMPLKNKARVSHATLKLKAPVQ